MKTLEQHRRYWERFAKHHGWYVQPFCIVAWLDESGDVTDSVSWEGLDRDLIMHA